jgi:DNA-directed RNA polymerase specialized sigma24 family protein
MDTAEEELRRAAERGARSVTHELQVVRDAAERTLQRWLSKAARQRSIADPEAWAFQVGKNAARELGRRSQTSVRLESCEFLDMLQVQDVRSSVSQEQRDELRRRINANKKILKGRQFEVALKLTEPGMSLHRAAKDLGMQRWNLRRSLQGALRRLILLET